MSGESNTSATPNTTPGPVETSGVVVDSTSEKPAESSAPVAAAVASETATTQSPLSPALTSLWTSTSPLLSTIHPEIWGVHLTDPSTHVPSQIILQKYLNANDQDIAKALGQLTKTLEWRKQMKPLELLERKFDRERFGGLGFVTKYGAGGEKGGEVGGKEIDEVFTWNIYGGVKNVDATFGKVDEFIHWRVALMELALSARFLDLCSAITPLEANPDLDPYKIIQVHDYKSISFLRSPPSVRAASTETIKVFAQNYPELLKEKFFVNVPAIMGVVYEVIKRFVAERTRKKFHPMANGAGLGKEFGKGLGEMLPGEYGGKGKGLVEVGVELGME